VANKLTVGREKDMGFCRAVLRQRLVNPADVAELIEQIEGIAPASRQAALLVTVAHAMPTGTTFAKVNPRASVDLAPPTLEDLPTIYDTDHQ
jgi:hypothetical protein